MDIVLELLILVILGNAFDFEVAIVKIKEERHWDEVKDQPKYDIEDHESLVL